MCEHYVARAAEPFRIDELWPFTEKLERYGLAGFGWGAAWLDADGRLASHRDVRSFCDDPVGAARVGAQETTSLLVHLRRPSRLSTLQLPDTQPFDDPGGRFSFSHNGDFKDWRAARATYREAGRIHGRADTEVAARWLEDAWLDGRPAALLPALHDRFGGQANLAVIASDGRTVSLCRQHGQPGLRLPARPDRHRVDRDLLARSLALPVRGEWSHRPSPCPPAHTGQP
jgi:hypothetical protein